MATSPTQSPIQALYIAFFQRPADAAGLAYWTGVLNQTHDLAAIAAGFANSLEFAATVAGKPQGDIVNGLFLAMFGRPVDPAGSAYWTQKLVSGALPLSTIVLSIMNGAQGIDQQALANRIGVADDFTSLVNGRATYSGLKDIAAAREFMGPVTDFFATVYTTDQIIKFIRDRIADPGDALYAEPTPPQPTNLAFTLTAGVDHIQGGDGNDTIVSTVGDGLGSSDTIDGGAGYDTLTVTDPRVFTHPAWEDLAASPVAIRNVEAVSITAAGTLAVDATGWTGLTLLTVQSNAGDPVGGFVSPGVLAPSTTALKIIAPALGDGAILTGGGSSVDVVANGSTGGFVFVTGTTPGPSLALPTGPITISVTSVGDVDMGDIYALGGTIVNVTQVATNPVNTYTTMGNVVVGGGPATTSATVTGSAYAVMDASTAGVDVGQVLISDYNYLSTTDAGIITSATVSNFAVLVIEDNALTTLHVSGGQGPIAIDNSGLTSPTKLTLNLTIDGQAQGILGDFGIYTTLNVATTGRDSTLDDLFMPALTALNLSGTKTLTLLDTSGVTGLDSITVTGSAGLQAITNLSLTPLTRIDASGTSGNVSVSIDATLARYLGGSGTDHVIIAGDATQTISLGDGDDVLELLLLTTTPTAAIQGGNGTDALSMDINQAEFQSLSSSFASKVTGFERLIIRDAVNQTVDLAMLGNYNDVVTNRGQGLVLKNMASGGKLLLDDAGLAYTLDSAAFVSGANDVINLKLSEGSGTGLDFANTGITAAGVETFAITTEDTQGTPTGAYQDAVTLLGNDVKTITVSGNAGLILTAASMALSSVDASGLTLGSFTWTAGVLAGTATVKGSASGANTFDGSAASGASIAYTGGSGNDTVKIGGTSSGKTNTVAVGSGTDTIVLTGIQADGTALTTVTGLAAGDMIDLSGVNNGAANTGQTTLGGAVPDQSSYSATLDLAAIGNGSATSIIKWFQTGGNTYVLLDTSNASNFVDGSDSVIKLVGLVNLSTATIAGNVITL